MTLRDISDWFENHYYNWIALFSGDLPFLDMPFGSIFWGLLFVVWVVMGAFYLFALVLYRMGSTKIERDSDNR